MAHLIALFRGINVGGTHKLPMARLIEILEGMGYSNVKTFIQSGNVVMESPKPPASARAISDAIEDRMGFAPYVQLLSEESFKEVLSRCPYSLEEGKAVQIFFYDEMPTAPNLEKLNSLKSPTEQFTLLDKAFYLYAPDGIGRSKLAASVEKVLGVPATARNGNTLFKLLKLLDDA